MGIGPLPRSGILGMDAVTNVEMKVTGTVLTITVDLSKRYGPSASGKTEIVASTNGNATVPGFDKLRLGLNVYEKR